MYPGTGVIRSDNPKDKAGFISKLLFVYTVPIFKQSSKAELEEKDIYKVIQSCKSKNLGDALENEWQKELKKPKKSLTKTLFRVFGGWYMWYGFLYSIVKLAHIMIKPLAVGKLISYFSVESKLTKSEAYYYAFVVIACTLITDISITHYLLKMYEIGLQIKVALCSLIYRKALKLSASSLTEVTTGKIVTMMTKDVLVFEQAIGFAHDLWIGLIQAGIMTYIMYQSINISVFIGMGFLILVIPVQVFTGIQAKNIRLKASAKTDERLRRIQEILTSIKLIKLYTWEKYFAELTNKLRICEMNKIKLIFYFKYVIRAIAFLSQRISFFLCILSYTYIFKNPLTAETAFVIVTCYSSLYFVLNYAAPMFVFQFAEAKSSLKRIKQYLQVNDINRESENATISDVKIAIKSADVKIYDKLVLKDININAGISLIGITGPVGSGKSTFLKMILKDVLLTKGLINVIGSISYASQNPWLFPATIQENILFGRPYEKERYNTVLKVSGLIKDLQTFPLNDSTIVTDKGSNLSKGQQARLNLARAIYKKSDIYLLDDVMTALDSNVSHFVFEECYKKFLKDKLVLMVCHNKIFLENTDRVLVFENGCIKYDNSYLSLDKMGVDFGTNELVKFDKTTETQANVDEKADEYCELLVTESSKQTSAIYSETKVSGKVATSIYKKYFVHAGGWKLIPFLLLLSLLVVLSFSYFDYYIKTWLQIGEELSDIRLKINEHKDNSTLQEKHVEILDKFMKTMNTYGLIIFSSLILYISQYFMLFTISSRASKSLHNAVFTKITGACLSFYDNRLSGNILNRFSRDITLIDEQLPYVYNDCITLVFAIFAVSGLVLYINLQLIIPTIIMCVILVLARNYYINISRNLIRLESITRAPVIGYLNTSLEGLTTIRAAGNQDILIKQFDHHQDLNSSSIFMYFTIFYASGFWLDILSNIYISTVILSFVISLKENLVAGDVGIAITQSFTLSGIIQWAIRQSVELENTMISVERVIEYETAKQEKRTGRDFSNWPTEGRIEFKSVNLYYNRSDKVILNNISFVIEGKEKIGIIGRTGAGKSSIISVLFRLYDINGLITIDDIDIKDIELQTVRSKISIIPQDPVLFAGTIRSNLDPYGIHSDLNLWNALEEVELKHIIKQFELGLSSIVNEGGSNFSIGQRQLICLARVILKNNKIIVLDEATANIDPQTDAQVQRTIKRLFNNCTILTIAHRLNTIINSDRIMVVDFGSIVEFDTPQTLLKKQTGILYSMAKQAGLLS